MTQNKKMNREIKFRAWDKKARRIFYAFFVGSLEGRTYIAKSVEPIEIELTEDFELMQFTGLTDKNGKEIYEGDILQKMFYEQPNNQCGNRPFGKPFEVKWSKTEGYCQECGFEGIGFEGVVENSEIIGNIYENPELLNQKNDPK